MGVGGRARIGEESLDKEYLPLHSHPSKGPTGCHTDLPSNLKLMLINASSFNNKTSFIHELVMDEERDLTCTTENLGGIGGGYESLSNLVGCWHLPWAEGWNWGEGGHRGLQD